MTKKYCRRCKRERERESEFQRNRSNKDGYNDWCKECWTAYQRQHDRDKRALRTAEQEAGQQAISRRYYEKHKVQVKAMSTCQDLLRRERLLHVQTEQIQAHEIFERDNWVCQLCGDPVDQTL